MPSTLYDLVWINPLPPQQRPAAVSQTQKNTLAKPPVGIPAAILYPALLSPAVVVGQDETIELLLAFRKADLDKLTALTGKDLHTSIKSAINWHLKVHKGLNLKKQFKLGTLFPGGEWLGKIGVQGPVNLNTSKIESRSKAFCGMLHETAVRFYGKGDYKYDQVFQVSLHRSALNAASDASSAYKRNLPLPTGGIRVYPDRWFNQDYLLHGSKTVFTPIKGEGRYAFKIQGEDVAVGEIDYDNPIQSYHPVFAYDQLAYANIAHMADVHVNSRQQILCRTRAKVIEHDDFKPVGDMMNICSLDARQLLKSFGEDNAVDIIVIGGDLVDFMNNAITYDLASPLKVTKIWEMVDMKKRSLYRDYVDFIAFYSLIVEFYQKSPKPAFVVTGNHDCYYESYGISPRVTVGGKELKRANEGIPWDHNLTMYEAMLSFGPTYASVLTGLNVSARPPSSFWKEKLAWFYTVLTPFSDLVLRLPNQYLAALGWGSSEDMLSPSRWSGQGFGHLPRANTAMSDGQYKLLKEAALDKNDGRKIILTTHFTFVSYHEEISNLKAMHAKWGDSNDEGDCYFTKTWYSTRDFSKADMGTFEHHREDMYRKVLAEGRQVQVILTGHSHRRGFYTMRKVDFSGNNSVKTGFHDFPVFHEGKPQYVVDHKGNRVQFAAHDQLVPWVILSDSGGSIPRMNLAGEFEGWGSDWPAGTKIQFDAARAGDVRSIAPVRVTHQRARPRLVVALDYMDILSEKVIKSFGTSPFKSGEDWNPEFRYEFKLELADCLTNREAAEVYGLKIQRIALYYQGRNRKLEKQELANSGGWNWALPKSFTRQFRTVVSNLMDRSVFLAVWFGSDRPHLARYDFSTPWTFEIKVGYESWGGWIRDKKEQYALQRHKKWREIPAFAARKKYPGY